MIIWQTIKTNIWLKWSLVIVAIFILLFVAVLGANAYVNNRYQTNIMPNVYLGSLNLSNLNYDQARDLTAKRIDFINQRGFVYNSELKTVVVYPNISSIEATDTYRPLVIWDLDTSIDQIFTWQDQRQLKYLWGKLQALLGNKKFPIKYQWDQDQHRKILEDNLAGLLVGRQDAAFSWDQDQLSISTEQAGRSFDLDRALAETQSRLQSLDTTEIALAIITDQPQVTAQDIGNKQAEIMAMSARGALELFWQEKSWPIANNVWRQWLKLKPVKGSFYLGIDEEKFKAYLEQQEIITAVFQPVQEAKFEIVDDKVTEFVSSQTGQDLNLEQTTLRLENWLAKASEQKLELVVEMVEPQISNANVNDLGIVEIIGIGESDFSGSPRNRIHNIGVGADTLNGLLIAPNEEFSLLKALGDIDGEHGYLQELVIKGNETKPEYGGGLCQIGTTIFRATIRSGLPVTERRNHSYRVRYYEPAGMDATIYDPAPDYKFINDTGNYVLIKTRIEETKLYFEFWGTKDGRQVTISEPDIYNIVAPPPEKIIKTIDLEAGVQKCTESAHYGADAKFDYSVQYPGSATSTDVTFRSHYVPWQKVCLLGVTPEELAAEQASSTPPVIEEGNTSTPPTIE